MKKVIFGSVIFCSLAVVISIFQASCSKVSANPQDVTQAGKIIYFTGSFTANTKLWIANYDGSNPTQVTVPLPANVIFDNTVNYNTLRISPDGQTIFFSVIDRNTPSRQLIYSCDQLGNNLGPVNIPATDGIYLGQAF